MNSGTAIRHRSPAWRAWFRRWSDHPADQVGLLHQQFDGDGQLDVQRRTLVGGNLRGHVLEQEPRTVADGLG